MLFDTTLLIVAAFVAGALNAVAGGGSFLTLPALVLTGIPAVSANATGTLALLPGYLAGAWGFRAETQPPPGLSALRLGLVCLLGGSTGAVLLLLTPDATFRRVVPWLLLLATFLFMMSPHLAGSKKPEAAHPFPAMLGVFAVTAYGATSMAGWAFCCWLCSACWDRGICMR